MILIIPVCTLLSRELGVAPSDLPALLTLPPLISQKEENTMAEILVEKLGLPALYLANKSVMALYGGGQMTGGNLDAEYNPELCNIPLQVLRWTAARTPPT